MTPFQELIAQGAANAWLFIPSAILLGALHGLEPGHSKTMMAAFIIAIRGTVAQAVMLGIAATVSHTIVVWAIALGGMYLYRGLDAETVEPYLQFVSGVIIIGMALWMIQRTWKDQQAGKLAAGDVHDHSDHDHSHSHDHGHDETRMIDTGHGLHKLVLHEDEHGARWRFSPERGKPWSAGEVKLKTERPDGTAQIFSFSEQGGYIESVEDIPEPHEFTVRLTLGHKDHSHEFDVSFSEPNVRMIDTGHGLHKLVLDEHDGAHWQFSPVRGKPWTATEVKLTTERPDGREQTFRFEDKGGFIRSVEAIPEPHDFMVRLSLGHRDHSHDFDVSFLKSAEGSDPLHEEMRGLQFGTDGYQDAHELAHANDIRKRFSGQQTVTNWQIILFGLTGGLIPCPAAITVLILCLQLKEIPLGAVMVLAFSIGLAITLVLVGAAAAIGVRHATARISWFSTAARRAPYFSGALLVAVGLYVGWHGWSGMPAEAAQVIEQAVPAQSGT